MYNFVAFINIYKVELNIKFLKILSKTWLHISINQDILFRNLVFKDLERKTLNIKTIFFTKKSCFPSEKFSSYTSSEQVRDRQLQIIF